MSTQTHPDPDDDEATTEARDRAISAYEDTYDEQFFNEDRDAALHADAARDGFTVGDDDRPGGPEFLPEPAAMPPAQQAGWLNHLRVKRETHAGSPGDFNQGLHSGDPIDALQSGPNPDVPLRDADPEGDPGADPATGPGDITEDPLSGQGDPEADPQTGPEGIPGSDEIPGSGDALDALFD